ncbi:hypothetical protein FOL46_008264 [Perkinsus olseni]|uniref:Uncharacterized protein n=1 Tax=Perkinsus olseni TaxID=32597 RepID=A0A7J6L873_PEROL|nr:hypothetical protein FOL46_008264 [Perkinsus olseni]
MTIICREPALLMLLVAPSLKAMHSSGEDLKASDVKKQTVDFSDLQHSAAETEISHVVEKQDGSLCVLDWYVSLQHEEAGLWITKREEVRVMARLDPEQKAFTFMKAFAYKNHGWRDIIVKDDKDELVVKAYEHSEDLGTLVYPEIKAGPSWSLTSDRDVADAEQNHDTSLNAEGESILSRIQAVSRICTEKAKYGGPARKHVSGRTVSDEPDDLGPRRAVPDGDG